MAFLKVASFDFTLIGVLGRSGSVIQGTLVWVLSPKGAWICEFTIERCVCGFQKCCCMQMSDAILYVSPPAVVTCGLMAVVIISGLASSCLELKSLWCQFSTEDNLDSIGHVFSHRHFCPYAVFLSFVATIATSSLKASQCTAVRFSRQRRKRPAVSCSAVRAVICRF